MLTQYGLLYCIRLWSGEVSHLSCDLNLPKLDSLQFRFLNIFKKSTNLSLRNPVTVTFAIKDLKETENPAADIKKLAKKLDIHKRLQIICSRSSARTSDIWYREFQSYDPKSPSTKYFLQERDYAIVLRGERVEVARLLWALKPTIANYEAAHADVEPADWWKVPEIDYSKVDFLEDAIEREKIYESGEQYEIYKDLKRIVKDASHEVFIVDAWPDESLYELYIDSIPNIAKVKILTKNPSSKFVTIGALLSRKRPLEIVEDQAVHDRYIFVDDKCWMLGASIKDAAKNKPTILVELDGRNTLYELWMQYFRTGKKLV